LLIADGSSRREFQFAPHNFHNTQMRRLRSSSRVYQSHSLGLSFCYGKIAMSYSAKKCTTLLFEPVLVTLPSLCSGRAMKIPSSRTIYAMRDVGVHQDCELGLQASA
jgi:hypothetical protein